jgi:hypothetical protein
MNRWLLHLLFLLHPLAQVFCQYDLMPLQKGRTWLYQFNRGESTGIPGMFAFEETWSGTIQFSVLGDSTCGSSIAWTVESAESMMVRESMLYPVLRDTVYQRTSRDTFAITEDLSGNHRLVSDSCSPPWLFPRRWYTPRGSFDTTGSEVFRYSPDPGADTLVSTVAGLPTSLWDEVIRWPDIGIVRASASVQRGPNTPYSYGWVATLLSGPTAVHLEEGRRAPSRFELSQCYPNPFNATTVIRYQLPLACQVTLVVFDMLGREVAELEDQRREAGIHEVRFDASDLSSGVYLCRIRAGDFLQARRLVLLK